MWLDNLKVFTAKKFGLTIFLFFIIYVTASNFLNTEETNDSVLLNRVQALIFEKNSLQQKLFNMTKFLKTTTLVAGGNKIPATNLNPEDGTIQTTKKKKPTNELLSTLKPQNFSIIYEKTSLERKLLNMTKFLKTTTLLAGGDRIPSTKLNHIDTTIQTTKKKKTTIKMSSTFKSQKTSSINRTLKPSKTHHKTTARPKHVVCLNFMGRLGNLMFQYAAAYGIARSKDMDVIISVNARISKIFHLDWGARVVKDTSRCEDVPISAEIRASAFNKETMDFKNDEDVALFGYLQSYKYFEKVSEELRRQFTFRDSIRDAAEDELSDILEDHLKKHVNEIRNWTFVAVHVRRGDMVNHPHGYMVAPKWYFQRTQNMFRALYQSVIFVVCSDDINWCKNNLKSDDTYFVTGNSPEVDMAILSSCNHTISSVGSFSWWSAWLGNGLVTYYFPPARPGSGLRRAYSKDYNDYFPPHWIRVEA